MSTPLETLQARLNEREVKLQSALMQTEEFDVVLNDFDNSMKEIASETTKGIVILFDFLQNIPLEAGFVVLFNCY